MANATTVHKDVSRSSDNVGERLQIWARALGCRPDQVMDVIQRAGLPVEKFWKSLDSQ
jgi:hypothetical protein